MTATIGRADEGCRLVDGKRHYGCGCPDCLALLRDGVQPRLTKDEAPCCLATMDAHGRMTPGYCGPDCLRRVTFEETNQ